MANVYSPESLGIKSPTGGFQVGNWYQGRQFWDGTLSDPGVIHPQSNQQGAGQAVSAEVNAQSAVAQGVSPQQLESYLQQQRTAGAKVTPIGTPTPVTAGQPTAPETAAMPNLVAPATINLPQIYESLYSSSGIKDLETQLADQTKTFTETKGKINDNPFLSEATRVGRIAKLETLFNERTANLRSDIATKKADIETQLNLQTKQFDINSQAAQQALAQFNTLMSLGAFDNATGEDIANVTRATGISSTMIQSAINANKAKDVTTSVIQSTNDAGVVTVSVVNTKTGEVIKQTSLGSIGNVQQGAKATEAEKLDYYKNQLRTDARNGVYLDDIFTIYSGYISPDDILLLYNSNSKWGAAGESRLTLSKKYGVKLQP